MKYNTTEEMQAGVKDTALSWYRNDLATIDESMQEVLESYSAIAPQDVRSHVQNVRDRAWDVYPYPCIGMWNFLNACVRDQKRYPEIRSRLQNGERFLDLGCALAQDIRQLVYDGVPADNLYGVDLEQGFIDVGYDLFLDKQSLKSKFIPGDIFDTSSEISHLDGTVDIVYAAQFFHLFGWDEAIKVGERTVKLLKPQKGVLIVGYVLGCLIPSEFQNAPTKGGKMYMHDSSTFGKLWDEIGEATGTKWNTEVVMDSPRMFKAYSDANSKVRRLSFCIERVD